VCQENDTEKIEPLSMMRFRTISTTPNQLPGMKKFVRRVCDGETTQGERSAEPMYRSYMAIERERNVQASHRFFVPSKMLQDVACELGVLAASKVTLLHFRKKQIAAR
jgi:hypothetical protein